MLYFFNQRYFQITKLNCDVSPLNSIWDVREKNLSRPLKDTSVCWIHSTSDYQTQRRERCQTEGAHLFPKPHDSSSATLSPANFHDISWFTSAVPGSSKCHESQGDIWYLWYHTLGSCQRTTTCQKDFAEERQNYKRLAEGPLSNWISVLLQTPYVPGFPGALVITNIGTA